MAEMKAGGDKLTIVKQEEYTSNEFAKLEKEKLWTRVWQPACRVEEIPNVGDRVLYEICDDSIIIVRTAEDTIAAYFNSCPHRGRKLVRDCGKSREFVCPFHGWRFDLQGNNSHIPYKEDWGDLLDGVNTSLTSLQCDSWGGWVFVNPDLDAPGLDDFLGEAGQRLNPFRYDEQSIKWTAAIELNGNWKAVMEAFNEGYHVQTTHPQFLPVFDEYAECFGVGPHGVMTVTSLMGQPSRILKTKPKDDVRGPILEFMRQNAMDIGSVFAERDLAAATRILDELPEDVNLQDANGAVMQYRMEAAIASGVGWPAMTLEQMMEGAALWHIFPNLIVLTGPTASLWYRVRPHGRGNDPEKCIFEIYALERYAKGSAPNIVKQYYTDWQDYEALPPFLAQDFGNLPHMQEGIRTNGFRGAILNPIQEQIIANFHEHLRSFIGAED